MTYRRLASHPLHALLSRSFTRAAAGALGAATPLMALANPTGGQVVAGAATISHPSRNGTLIDQSSQRAVINWQQFNVGTNQYVQFLQPDSSAVLLNRIVGGNASEIFGAIKANGQVFLVNPNGLYFAPSASIDVGGLVASTLDIKDADFMAGNYVFSHSSGAAPAVVGNQGRIQTSRGGYVVLAGDHVQNGGQIDAQFGRVYLAAGNAATLTLDDQQLISYSVDGATLSRLAGVSNTGEIAALGGAVVMTADVANTLTATAVNNSGVIAAHSVRDHGGIIVLAAEGGDITNTGVLDASAAGYASGVTGGAVILRGDGHTQLDPNSVIDTAGNSAKGGFIELSGHTLGVRGVVTAGRGGTLLIDPTIINIVSGGQSHAATSPSHLNSVGTAFIASKLNAGSNVSLVASTMIQNLGGTPRTITATGANANKGFFELVIGTVTSGCGLASGICVGAGSFPFLTQGTGTITLTGLTININGSIRASAGQGPISVDTINANNGITLRGGTISVNGNLTAGAGALSIAANHGPTPGFIKTAAGVTLKAGFVNLNAGGSYGGNISVGTVSGASINIADSNPTALPSSLDKIVTGALTGTHINISATGRNESIVTGPITAVNATQPVRVNIVETASGTGAITVNGNITLSGKLPVSIGGIGKYDLAMPAELDISDTGSGNGARNVTINGAVDLTAIPTHYTASSGNEAGPIARRTQTGTGGMAGMFLVAGGSHGSVSFAGPVTMKGADAVMAVKAHSVTTGNITVTGSGHHLTRSIVRRSGSAAYASSNSAGQAVVALGAIVLGSGASSVKGGTVKTGNITVSGKGIANADLLGSHVSAGNVSVTATAAKGKITANQGNTDPFCVSGCTNINSSHVYNGVDEGIGLHKGSLDFGQAEIGIASNNVGSGARAVSIKTGTLGAVGAGQALVTLDGTNIQTHGVTITATKGTLKGSGSSVSGVTAPNTFKHVFDISGGDARFKVRSGSSGNSGVLTQNGGPVIIAGNVTVTGPTASVDIKGKTIKVGGGVTVTGSGESFTSDTVFTPPVGTGYHVHLAGPAQPTSLFLQGATSGSVSVAGPAKVKGPGLVGIIALAGGVTLHGVSASASAAVNYSLLDTRVSPTAQNFTAGDVAFIVSDVVTASGKAGFTPASDVGNVTLDAKGGVELPAQIKVNGILSVKAAASIIGSSNHVVARFNAIGNAHPHAGSNGGGGPSSGGLPALSLSATSASMVAGGSIDLTGATAKVKGEMQLVADKNIILTGVNLSVGVLDATASGSILDGGTSGAITAGGLALVAGKNIAMQSTAIAVGSGTVPGVTGDLTLLLGLSGVGLAPSAPAPNATFIAGGNLSLGNFTLTGSYLYLQAANTTFLGKVTVPTGSVVQLSPIAGSSTIDVEDQPGTGGAFNLSNSLDLSLFPGTTLVVGNSAQTGDITLGTNGVINLGNDNFIVATSGNITGLNNIITTGIVSSLESLLGNAVAPPTSGEIDPNSSNNNNTAGDKKHQGEGGGEAGANGTQGGGITQDTSGGGACH